MDDEWVVLGATLGCKNFCNSSFVQGIGRQTVDRFGGNTHHFAAGQQPSGLGNVSGRAVQ